MDSGQFDDLLRLFSHSRRSAIAALLAAAGGATVVEGRKKRRKKRKKQRKGPSSCTPSCAGKTCGDDGCGGSCGACFQGTCAAGTCTCATGYEFCRDACRVQCPGFEQRNPDTCECCGKVERPCGTDGHCCSGNCEMNMCRGRNGLEPCTFDEQCHSRECQDGLCTCLGTVCKGVCGPTCDPTRSTQNPASCACCLNNGIQSLCPGGDCACCCSGLCDGIPRVCIGRPNGALCEFPAQCASGACDLVSTGGDFYVLMCV